MYETENSRLGYSHAPVPLAAGLVLRRRVSDRRVRALPRRSRAPRLHVRGADRVSPAVGIHRHALRALQLVPVRLERHPRLSRVAADAPPAALPRAQSGRQPRDLSFARARRAHGDHRLRDVQRLRWLARRVARGRGQCDAGRRSRAYRRRHREQLDAWGKSRAFHDQRTQTRRAAGRHSLRRRVAARRGARVLGRLSAGAGPWQPASRAPRRTPNAVTITGIEPDRKWRQRMRVLVVEDDALLGDAVQAGLIQAGFAVDWVRDGVAATHALQTDTYAAVVLDLGLPRLSGLDVLRRLRERDDPVPVLILTARDTVDDRVQGLDAGADDYLIKPFDMGELGARLRALIR